MCRGASNEHNSATISNERNEHESTSVPWGDVACSGGNHRARRLGAGQLSLAPGEGGGRVSGGKRHRRCEPAPSRKRWPAGWASPSSSTTGPAQRATSRPRRWRRRSPTATRSSSARSRTRSTPHFPNSNVARPGQGFRPGHDDRQRAELLVVHPSLGVTSVDELIRAAKAKPGQITFASSGNGTSPHLSGELFSVHGRHQDAARAVQGQHAGGDGPARRPGAAHVLAGFHRAAAHPRRQAEGAGVDRRQAHRHRARSADDRRARPQGLRNLGLVRLRGAGGHAARRASRSCRPPRTRRSTQPDVQELFRAQGIEVVKSSPDEFARYIRSETASGPRSSRPPASSPSRPLNIERRYAHGQAASRRSAASSSRPSSRRRPRWACPSRWRSSGPKGT